MSKFTGNVGAAPILRKTSGGKDVCNVRLAVDEDQGSTLWLDVAVWKEAALDAAKLNKGARITVEGSIRERPWTGRDGQWRMSREVSCESFERVGVPVGSYEQPDDYPPRPEQPLGSEELPF